MTGVRQSSLWCFQQNILRNTVWLHKCDQSSDFKTCLPFSIPSANVGYRSHCGCGPGPCVLYGILYLQEMLQQGQEAQESTREERRTGPKEEGQGWRRRRGRREEGEERWGGHWILCLPEVFLDHFNCITAEFRVTCYTSAHASGHNGLQD